jgi:hypothetical protein
MRLRLFITMAVVFAVIGPAHGDQYQCRTVDKISRCAAPSGTWVSITADSNKKRCGFSIGGEPIRWELRKAAQDAVAAIHSGRIASELRDGKGVQKLTALLLAGSDDTESPQLADLIASNRIQLAQCFESLAKGTPPTNPRINQNLECGATAGGLNKEEYSVSSQVDGTQAFLAASLSDSAYFLFLN